MPPRRPAGAWWTSPIWSTWRCACWWGRTELLPCIVYERSEISAIHADNAPYRLLDRYQVTAIYKNPDSDLPHRLAMLPMCAHDRHFTADNLNHDIFNLYY